MQTGVAAVPTWEWVLAFAFLLGSSFSSSSETALTALGEARARQLAESGGRRARWLGVWIEHPDRVLSTLLIANTLVNIGAGALAGEIASQIVAGHPSLNAASAVAVATGVTTVVILLFGEIIPKTLAKRTPVRVAMWAIGVVMALYWLFWPLSTGLVALTSQIVARLGGARTGAAVTSEEIEYLIDLGTREGVLDEVKEELLNSVLEFADLVVKEIMVPRTRMVAVDRDAPPEEILRIVTDNPYTRMPVYEETIDNIVGVLLVRDIVKDLRAGATLALPKYLKPAFFVPEQMKISRLLKEMQRRRTHLAIVVDEFGGTSGLVTLEDVIEEIVGDIEDEADVEAAQPVKSIGEGVFLADATISLRELAEFLNGQPAAPEGHEVVFPEDGDYETLGGFVTATAGRVPAVGATVAWDGLVFTVRGGDERRVTKVEIARRPAEQPGAQEASGRERPATP